MEPPLAVTVLQDDEHRLTLAVVGELDLATASILESALEQAGARDVTLDLAGLLFLDSTGIRVLVSTHNDLEATGHRLTLRRCGSSCRRTLQVAGLGGVFRFER